MPGSERLRPWPLAGLAFLALVLGAAAVVVVMVAGGDPQVVAAVVSVASTLLTGLVTAAATSLWRRRHWRGLDPSAALAEAADDLAEAVSRQWEPALADRRLRGPIPVRWAWSRPLSGRVDDAVGQAGGLAHGRFPPLPGTAAATAATVRSGGLPELFAVYAGLSSGRMVVLGGPGAGKSGAAILTVLEALEHRRGVAAGERAQVPVPVLLTAQTWDPRRQSLEDWVAERLASDFRFLRAPKYGPDVARRLVRERRVALFLDGFDELAAAFRPVALEVLSERATSRVVLFSRTEEYAEAVRRASLRGAAALALRPVPPRVAADYLARLHVAEPSPQWRRLVDRLRAAPGSPLAQALASPLTVSLARDTFPDPDELDELLAPDRFASPAEVEDHLLDRVLPAAYRERPGQPPGRYDLAHARRWLGFLATAMDREGTRELAWWRMHRWASAAVRVAATTLLGALTAAATAAVIGGLTEDFGDRDTIDAGPAAIVGLVIGFAIGLAVERRESPVGGLTGPAGARFNPAMALVSGIAVWLAASLTLGPTVGAPGLVIALAAAAAAGTATGLASQTGLQRSGSALPPQAGAAGTLRAGFTQGLPAGLATGIPIGLATGVPVGLGYGAPAGLVIGLVIGVTFLLAFGLVDGFSAASLDVAAPLDPISAWRQDRRRSVTAGLVFGLAVGVAAGVTDAMAMARHDPPRVAIPVGVVTGVAVGIATTVAAALTVSSTWRGTLLFLQLRARGDGPARGMHFLEDAHQRNVLRVVGSVYQFRHARLQDHLARTHRSARAPKTGPPRSEPGADGVA
ncbi:hypothetical protein RB614_42485 [Phytohabitans sp. ZYX-F-186]|uniref:NACHT domain-containing protein n=1 Tax=Phytohabitans maris TaxID=3071409 RepID=A0ABU0ZXF1_9ACTN|nr:hypothetical protein [Phytohabitans sp. ZYX-F-186]MDQ7911177.1 hypothetical protein [Phytohabitans sp. ZYX-F-186]